MSWPIDLQIHSQTTPYLIALLCALIGGVYDQVHFRIPNRLTFSVMIGGGIYHLLPFGDGIVYSIGGLFVGAAILLPFFLLGGMGAGDVKLFAAIGAFVGVLDVITIFILFGLLTGILSSVVIYTHRSIGHPQHQPQTGPSERRVEETLRLDPSQRQRSVVPLAPMLALAMLILCVTSA